MKKESTLVGGQFVLISWAAGNSDAIRQSFGGGLRVLNAWPSPAQLPDDVLIIDLAEMPP